MQLIETAPIPNQFRQCKCYPVTQTLDLQQVQFQITFAAMAIGELRALPVGRGQIGKVKYIPVGLQGRGGRGIPSSVIKTGVKLPQMETVQQKEKVRILSHNIYINTM